MAGKILTGKVRSMRRNMKQGFSLIELLVVIAIISILAGFLLPTLEEANYHAGNISCMNNLKQNGLQVTEYTDDFYGSFPVNAWYTSVMEYSESFESTKFCPIQAFTDYASYKAALTPGPGWVYSMNIDLTSLNGWANWTGGAAKTNMLKWPSRTMCLADGGYRGPTYPHSNDYNTQTLEGRISPYASPAHPDEANSTRGVNHLYVDGHVSSVVVPQDIYPWKYKKFWGREGTQSWNLSPYSD